MTSIELKDKGAISKNRENADPRTRPENRRGVPNSVASNILGYESSITSEDDLRKQNDPYRNLPHSPNSLFEFRNPVYRAKSEQEQK